MLLGGDGAWGESQCRRMTSIGNTNLVIQYLHNVQLLLRLKHWKIHEDINRFQVCVCCLKDHFNMEFFQCLWIQSAVHATFTSTLMFSSLHAFYCLILSAGFLLQFDRNSLPSTIALHSDGQLHCTAALQTMEGLNRYCLKAGQGKQLIIFLLMIQLPTGPPQDYSAVSIVQMAPVAACNKDTDVEQKGSVCIKCTREGKAVS